MNFLLITLFLLGPLLPPAPVASASAAPATVPPSYHILPPWALPYETSAAADTSRRADPPLPQAVLEPALARLLYPAPAPATAREEVRGAASSDMFLRVIVVLREQAEPEEAVGPTAAPSAAGARARIVAAKRALADRTQAPLRAYLDSARAAGLVEDYTPFWIFNGIALRAHPDVIRALAARPDVALIRRDHYRRWLPAEMHNAEMHNTEISDACLPNVPNPEPRTPNSEFRIPNSEPRTPDTEWNIAVVRAPEVWASLNIRGTGAVVAGMDTGVDWLHPALRFNYRGYNPHGPAVHEGNWFDPVTGSLYPIDDHGHGSHTLGTAVGGEGIGVAPGARWIAVKMLDRYGYGYDSWIHAGFQWLLAPGGDPARAPDVVNCSWGDENAASTVFQDDIRALRAAGLFVVFANGNHGPEPATVISPASLPEAFAVGASDPYDGVAYFSSRGPSPWGEVRPHVVAPGVSVRSALPGGTYGRMSGTSMATPHVAGLVALLRAVSPSLSITETAYFITSTAVPLSTTLPNNDSGWGRIDTFAAVSALMNAGMVQGTVRRAGDGAPLPGATVTATPRGGSGGGSATTDADGRYTLPLAPAVYDLTATAFAHEPATRHNVSVTVGSLITADFALTPLPTGTLQVFVTDASDGRPVTATVRVLDTPLEATAAVPVFTLPGSLYTLRARALGYYVVTATAAVTIGETTAVTLSLPPAPSVLLIDSGAWYYESQIAYYRQALDDLSLAYDEHIIRRIPDDVPTAEALQPYNVVVWSAPWDGPGYIGAQNAVTEYLSSGGNLFLSGQDIGFVDAVFPYYYRYLKSRLVADSSEVWRLDGLPDDLFASLTLTITGPGGADNQYFPDVVDTADPNAALPVLAYHEDGCGGLRVGVCLPYRALYLSFGFEAITDRETRREVMRRALDWLTAPPPAHGLELRPTAATAIGVPGTVVTHEIRIRNLGSDPVPDVMAATLQPGRWPARLSAPYLILPSCTSGTLVVSVTVPVNAGWDDRDVLTLTVRSVLSPALSATAVLTTKAPAPVLMVDDDRWYDQQEKYRAALDGAGVPYDLWETHPALGGGGTGGPPPDILRRYPIVVWWTGYDWFEPVSATEEEALREYLDGGGRLFLSAQDFLYYHAGGPLASRLGVLTCTEDVTPTLAAGVPEDSIGDGLGPWPLVYPAGYRNWSDEVFPMPGTAVVFRDQAGRGIGLARRGPAEATVFFPFPSEALPEEERPGVMERIVGWLSWLGRSSFVVDRGVVAPGESITFTLHLVNDGPQAAPAAFSATVPAELELVPGSLTGPATYDPDARRVGWAGALAPGDGLTVTWAAAVTTALPSGARVTQTVRLALSDQRIAFARWAVVRVDGPDLGPSALRFIPPVIRSGDLFTGLLVVENRGVGAASAAAVISLPLGMEPVAGSLAWEGDGAAETVTGGVRWEGPLAAGAAATVTWRMRAPATFLPALYGVAFLEDGAGGRWERRAWVEVRPWRMLLPLILKGVPAP